MSGDLISRQAVINLIRRCNSALEEPRIFVSHNSGNLFECYITELPSVNPQEPKTGHWIEKDGFDGDVYYDCSECGESWTTIEGTPWDNEWDYCPSCGARMVEPQESEDKCKNCEYYHNPDYTRCHKCKAESEGEE